MPADDALPATIGPYRVEGLIGRGGMGVVYRGSSADGQLVALKVLRTDATRPEEMRDRFAQEARVRIEHPNIVRTIDAGTDGSTLWIAFELLRGKSVSELLAQRGRLSIEEVIAIGRQAAAGLAAAHAAGVVHRDIKPGNLFLEDDGVVKLLDFGIARITDRDTRLTATGHLVGTAAYLSPEQARAEAVIDARSDVWSLGVVLYEALTGKHPFERGSLMATMLAVLAEHAPPVTTLRTDVPAPLAHAIARCLERLPERRFANGGELERALAAGAVEEQPRGRSPDATAAAQALPGASIPIGEQRVVAVMLAEGVRDRDAIHAAVEAGGGVLVPLGERALGLFGSTAWEGDEIDRAARAALIARESADRVSVASGRARYSGTTGITGSVLESAEEGCRAGVTGIALDETTARALRSRWHVRARGGGGELVSAEPKERPDTGTGRTLLPPSHGVTVGREAELAQLRRALRTLDEDAGAEALLIVGPPGSGKSHLRWEMMRILEREARERPRILATRCEPLHRDVAFSLFRELIRARAQAGQEQEGWPPLDGSSEERRGAIAMLAREANVDPAFVAELLSAPGMASGELTAAQRDPRLMADRLRLTVHDWASALCDAGPVALLLDDLQWADDASLDLLEELAGQLAEAPLFVLACARPELVERRPELVSAIFGEVLEPRALLPSEVEELASAIAGRPLPLGLARRLAERTGGNPLFVEQIVRTLDEEGRLDDAADELPLPLTVEATVQSRLDHLPAAEKELCKRAAIFERAVSASELEVLGVFEPRPLLAALVRREVLAARGRARGMGRYQFRSVLVREVAYGMLGDALREELHARIAAHLAKEEDADPEEIAVHFDRAHDRAHAAEWHRRAAKVAGRRGDPATVLRCSARALELGGLDDAARCELYLERSEALQAVGRLDEQGVEHEAASACARSELERAKVAIDRAVWLWRTGLADEAIATARAAVELARAAGDGETLALALGRSAMILTYAGALDEARDALAEAEPIARAEGVLLSAHAASWQAQLANARGDQGERRRAYREAVRLYEQAGDLRRAAGAEINLADAANRTGAYVEAASALAAASEKADRLGNAIWRGYAQLNLGYAMAMLGRAAEARAALAAATSAADETGEERLRVFAQVYLARVALGDAPNEAASLASEAAADAEAQKLAGLRAIAWTVAAAAHLACDRHEDADRASALALAIRDELGSLEEDEGEVFLVRARVLEAMDRYVEAEDVRQRGRARVRELADRIADPELRARYLEDVAAHRELVQGA